MKRLNKFFTKKEREDHISPPEPTALANQSPSELCALIYRYDEELKRLNPLVAALQEERDKALSASQKHFEESTLYKQLAEATQLQLQSSASEVNDIKEVLQSKKAEVELLRSQMMTQEEVNAQYKRELEVLKSGEEGDRLRGELARLKEASREETRAEERMRELEIVKKNLEAELMRMSLQAENSASQLKLAKDKISKLTEKARETELQVHQKQQNLDNFRQEAATFAFQKESIEAEIKALKDLAIRKDEAITKKKRKIAQLKSDCSKLKSDLDSLRSSHHSQLVSLQTQLSNAVQDSAQRLADSEEVARLQQEQLARDLQDKQKELEQAVEALQSAYTRCEEKEGRCVVLEEQVKELLQAEKSLLAKVEQSGAEEVRLKEMLEAAQKKREQARTEVIKLSQKLEQRPSPMKEEASPLPSFFPGPIDIHEARILPRLKFEVEQIYKSLMKALLSAKDSPYPSDDLTKEVRGLLMESELFSEVERKLNDLVMHVHEGMDALEPDSLVDDSPQSWSGMITSAVAGVRQAVKAVGPVKLFSCMPNSREHPTAITMKPRTAQGRKLVSSTGGDRKVDQQQTPPLGYKRF